MKSGMVFLFILLAVISLILGVLDKFIQAKLLVRSYTWHELAQTFLLFGIAWGVWQNALRAKKED